MPETPLPNPVPAGTLWKNFAGLALMVAVLALLFWYFDVEALRAYIEGAGPIAPLLFILAKAATIVIAPINGSPLYPIGGALFGFWKGVGLLVLGDMLGGTIAFWISRLFGKPVVLSLLGSDNVLFNRALSIMGTIRGYAIARLCLISMPEIASFGAGLTRLKFLPFIVIYTVIGSAPSILFSWFGDALVESGNNGFVALAPLIMASISVVSTTIFMVYIQRTAGHEILPGTSQAS